MLGENIGELRMSSNYLKVNTQLMLNLECRWSEKFKDTRLHITKIKKGLESLKEDKDIYYGQPNLLSMSFI